MASELFAVAVAYVPRSVASVTAAPLHYLWMCVVFCRLGITSKFWLPNKRSVCSSFPCGWRLNLMHLDFWFNPAKDQTISWLTRWKRLTVPVRSWWRILRFWQKKLLECLSILGEGKKKISSLTEKLGHGRNVRTAWEEEEEEARPDIVRCEKIRLKRGIGLNFSGWWEIPTSLMCNASHQRFNIWELGLLTSRADRCTVLCYDTTLIKTDKWRWALPFFKWSTAHHVKLLFKNDLRFSPLMSF